MRLAEIYEEDEQWNEAANALARAQTLNPRAPMIARRRAVALLSAGRASESRDLLKSTIASGRPDAKDPILLYLLAESQRVRQRPGRGAGHRAGAHRGRSRGRPRPSRAVAHPAGQGRRQRRRARARDLIARDPMDANALNSLGYMLAERRERLDEAVTLVQRALKIEPGNPSYLDSLGWAYFQQGRLDLADRAADRGGRQAADQLGRPGPPGRPALQAAPLCRCRGGLGAGARRGRPVDRQGQDRGARSATLEAGCEAQESPASGRPVPRRRLLRTTAASRCRLVPGPPFPDYAQPLTRRQPNNAAACGRWRPCSRSRGEPRATIACAAEARRRFRVPGRVRLEFPAPGRPIFTYVAVGEDATLVLPREGRVLRNAPPAATLEALSRCRARARGPADHRRRVRLCRRSGHRGRAFDARLGGSRRRQRSRAGCGRPMVRGRSSLPCAERSRCATTISPLVSRQRSGCAHRPSAGWEVASVTDLTIRLSQVDINEPLGADVVSRRRAGRCHADDARAVARGGPLGRLSRHPSSRRSAHACASARTRRSTSICACSARAPTDITSCAPSSSRSQLHDTLLCVAPAGPVRAEVPHARRAARRRRTSCGGLPRRCGPRLGRAGRASRLCRSRSRRRFRSRRVSAAAAPTRRRRCWRSRALWGGVPLAMLRDVAGGIRR